jgi:hypothetical protein
MQHLSSIASAIKAKSPIVALPIEGHAPVCVDRKRLAGWSKGVAIHSAKVETFYQFEAPKLDYSLRRIYGSMLPEGPHNRLEGHRMLTLKGIANKRIKTTCRMVVIDRRTAVRTLSEWSAKERAKLLKKTFLGALAKEQKRSLKMLGHGDAEGSGTITFNARRREKDGKESILPTSGVAVSLPAFPETDFVIHPAIAGEGWTVSERYTGFSVGSGDTAEKALVTAQENIAQASPASRAKVLAQVLAAKAAA